MKKTFLLLIAIIMLSGFVGFGIAQYNPKVIYEPVPYPEYHYITQEVPIVIEKIVETEKTVEVPIRARHFKSVKELESWLDSFGTFYVGGTSGEASCGDWVIALQAWALRDGYLLNIDVVTRPEYNLRFKEMYLKYTDPYHGMVSAVIGNKIYYIEPQNFESHYYYYFESWGQ